MATDKQRASPTTAHENRCDKNPSCFIGLAPSFGVIGKNFLHALVTYHPRMTGLLTIMILLTG